MISSCTHTKILVSIDYQLCLSVSETLCNVLYIRDYLERLLIGYEQVTNFAPSRVTALLERASPDYRDLLVNL